ncbi:hypothetical protein SAMN02982929_04572 [Saccharopolyspora kobensis]|uniref:Uncharacterized protein n=1 Tax=Saccharopolyspora kobensis TaxID=146035 RepID=A0A1H6DJM4_9PSEU|nr:hypothetical protein [Saccharopolyspora kobensis]SEG85341.1 hypothetical protein SAMN02982929_04572 [Saccharopolyspora kobensis]SFD24530.1 hypothetical protein SAMN05216506_103218 [Saccharopolyspora kobensis]
MGNRVKKAVVASGFGLGMLLATAAPAFADSWGVTASDCEWAGGEVVYDEYGSLACFGGWYDGEHVYDDEYAYDGEHLIDWS